MMPDSVQIRDVTDLAFSWSRILPITFVAAAIIALLYIHQRFVIFAAVRFYHRLRKDEKP